LPSGLLE